MNQKKEESSKYNNFVLGCGNPLLDISSPVSDEFMKKYDIRPANAILADPKKHLPMYDELSKMDNVEYIPGGSTLNSIRVCQWMLQKNGNTGYMGCIGKDKYGKLLSSGTVKDGVTPNFMIHDKIQTGTCAVCLTNKERSLVANLAAANEFNVSHLSTSLSKDFILSSKVIYTAGFHITVSPDAMKKLANESVTKGIPFAINFSAEFICTVPPFVKTLLELIPLTTHIFTNEDEIKTFGKSNKIEYKTIKELACKISLMKSNRKESRKVICTQGKNPVILACQGKAIEYPVPLLKSEDIVDLNGAGDGFVGGFLSQLVQGKSDDICVQAGNYAARYIIQTSGTKLVGKPNFNPKK